MRSTKGRKLILASIEEWRAAIRRKSDRYAWKINDLKMLQTLEESVFTDFAIVNSRITSRCEYTLVPI